MIELLYVSCANNYLENIVHNVCATKKNLDWQGNLARKRPFGNEDSYGISCKYPRPAEHAEQLNLSGKVFTRSDIPQDAQTLGMNRWFFY